MATIDDKHVIDELIKNNGHYSDDPPVLFIVEYRNMVGRLCWGIIYDNEAYRLGSYMALPMARLIFQRKN